MHITNGIANKKYNDILDFISTRCDMFTFCIPDYNYRIITEQNKHLFCDNDTQETIMKDISSSRDLYNAYEERTKSIRESLLTYLVRSYNDVIYLDQIRQYKMTIYLYAINSDSINILKSYTNNLFSWKYPTSPEDLCFFSKGRCFLQSIAHEKLCYIYPSNKFDMSIIKGIRLKYFVFQDEYNRDMLNMNYILKYEIDDRCRVMPPTAGATS